MAKKSRDKGKRGEREACEVLRPIFPNVRRRISQSRGGSEGADLDCTPGYHVEVGVGNVNPRAKWEQANEDSARACHCEDKTHPVGSTCPEVVPIALTRRDHGAWLVTIHSRHFTELMQEIEALQSIIRQGLQRGLLEESARISIEGERCGWRTGPTGPGELQCTQKAGHEGRCTMGLAQGSLARVGP